jgi:dTDP-4-amino-4,6-dideoxygalactose transaminase
LLQRLNDILDRRWLTNGGFYVNEFEERIAKLTGVAQCVAICNATAGLEIAIRALGLKGEVIVPSFTFIATAHALQWQEITPVFCDIDRQTHCLDPEQVERLITPRTTGIIGVHLWGRPCDIDSLTTIAAKNGLKLIFDSAHAFGCTYKGRPIGGFGDAEVFSFHATKFLNSMEGGAVVTNDSNLADKLRLMRNFGFTNYDQTDSIGVNGKMNEAAAAMGITNLESMAGFIATNHRHYKQYQEELAELPGITLLEYDARERSNYQYVVLEIEETATGVSRDQLMQILHAERVLVRRYFYPGCHRMEPYLGLFADAPLSLPQTESVAERVLTLPTGEAVTPAMIRSVCGLIRIVLDNANDVRKLLEERLPA